MLLEINLGAFFCDIPIRAGYLDYTIALGTLKYLSKESKYVPWRTALNSLGFLDDVLSDRRGNGYFQVLLRYCFECSNVHYVIPFAFGTHWITRDM